MLRYRRGSSLRIIGRDMETRARQRSVPPGVVACLPIYLNCLVQLRSEGEAIVSSAKRSAMAEVNAAQIRRDLAQFGSFGRRGRGYEVEDLIGLLQHILRTSGQPSSIVITYARTLRHAAYAT